jgi:hypothetical protein
VRREGLAQLKKSNDIVGNRARDFPASSIVPQPTTLPHVPTVVTMNRIILVSKNTAWKLST